MTTAHPRDLRPLLSFALVAALAGCKADLVTRNVRTEPFLTTTRALKATVVNQGKGSAAASTGTVLTVIDPSTATSSSFATPALQAGGTYEWMTTYTPPPPGQCMRVTVCADSPNAVPESAEGNNCATAAFSSSGACP